MENQEITVTELNERIKAGTAPPYIDVREEWEFDNAHLENAIHIPLGEIPNRLAELAKFKGEELVMICRSGGRSGRATNFLISEGFSKVRNMSGGMLAWRQNIDPTIIVE